MQVAKQQRVLSIRPNGEHAITLFYDQTTASIQKIANYLGTKLTDGA